jgi:hypothetical protein
MVYCTMGVDTSTINPCCRVDSIKVGGGREGGEVYGERKSKEGYKG